MNFEWDADKNRINRAKHNLRFEEARLIFDGPIYSRTDDRRDYGEIRVISVGLIREVVAVAVVHTDRDCVIRIISARLANQRERQSYHDNIRQASR